MLLILRPTLTITTFKILKQGGRNKTFDSYSAQKHRSLSSQNRVFLFFKSTLIRRLKTVLHDKTKINISGLQI